MSTLRTILIGGIVGGIVMGAAFLLLPDTPVYEALSMAVGVTAGALTWRQPGESRETEFGLQIRFTLFLVPGPRSPRPRSPGECT